MRPSMKPSAASCSYAVSTAIPDQPGWRGSQCISAAGAHVVSSVREAKTCPRHEVRRIKDRAHYDRATAYAILDAAFVAHVGFCVDAQPFVIPMLYARD